MELEPGTKFLETNISVLWGYHLVCTHRNVDVDKIMTALHVPNFRVVPYNMHTTNDARMEYVRAMFTRVEQNSMFAAHIAIAILEMVVELRLHQWPLPLILKAIRIKEHERVDGAYGIVRALIRAS